MDFSNNVLDSTKQWNLIVKTKAELDGLPESVLEQLQANYKSKVPNKPGNDNDYYLLTLDGASYRPVIKYQKNRELRRKIYTQSVTRQSEIFEPLLLEVDGVAEKPKQYIPKEKDNTPIIEEILKLSKEVSQLVGFKNSVEFSMQSKMATMDEQFKLQYDMVAKSKKKAQDDLLELQKFQKEEIGFTEKLEPWDVSFYSNKLREKRYQFDSEDLKPYFSLPNVMKGLWALVKRLFDIDVIELGETDIEALGVQLWHKDCKFFKIERQGELISYFYFDPYTRPQTKNAGQWMGPATGRTLNPALVPSSGKPGAVVQGGKRVRVPVQFMVCNQTEPVGDKPSLMKFRAVEILFHEFGHAMQHMLTTETEAEAQGTSNIEWDAIELPSQFMENWQYDKPTVDKMAKHYKTGEPIPNELFEKMKAQKTYHKQWITLQQMHQGLVDLKLFSFDGQIESGGKTIWAIDEEVGAQVDVMPKQSFDRWLCSFSHVFAGAYSQGYYSYKWAEVLSQDSFAQFEEVGLDNEAQVKKVGAKFRDTVLAMGGGRHPSEVFREFRGRDSSIDAVLRHNGLLADN